MPKDTFYVTTPIYYINAKPHVGHAYTTIAGDALCRYKRLCGEKVVYVTGTDEHGRKNVTAAAEKGQTPQEFADENSAAFREMWEHLHIEYDRFIRTSEPRHVSVVQQTFKRLVDRGDIYLGRYEGFYCVPCETYLPQGELSDGNCPECGRAVEMMTQDCYFFRTSQYADRLLEHLDAHPAFVQPESRQNELISFVKGGLRDMAVSRRADAWDIPIPGDPANTVYVWVDALLNYLTVASYLQDDEDFERLWPPDVQLMAKDILTRFHGTLWPSMLMALGLPLPKTLLVHGFWDFRGAKMSKSRGNVVDPYDLAQQLSRMSGASVDVTADAIRYFLLRQVPFGADGEFTETAVIRRFNEDLANDLGNLLHRTLPLIVRFCDGKVPSPAAGMPNLDAVVRQAAETAGSRLDELDFVGALQAIWTLLGAANKYIDQQAPWNLHKRGNTKEAGGVLYVVADAARAVATLVSPFMPSAAQEARSRLGAAELPVSWDVLAAETRLRPGAEVRPGKPVFPRIETKVQPVVASAERRQDVISFEEFQKVDLRVAEIKSAERVEGADKLLKLTIDLGSEERVIVAGIAEEFRPDSLLGKKIVVVANLEPARIRGVVSEGMLLAAGEDVVLSLVTVDDSCPPGTRVR
ncbi:MAG: methionine--tRNA ligase [Armatimonadota bacterium]